MKRSRERGLTLAEIVLVIVIGLSLIYAATILYMNAKSSAGMAKARDRVLDLQQVIEQMATAGGGQYPNPKSVAEAWKEKHADADSSPWGGRISYRWRDPVAGGEYPGIHVADLPADTYTSPDDPIYRPPADAGAMENLEGLLEYRRIVVNPLNPGNPNRATLFDDSIKRVISVMHYAVWIRNPGKVPILIGGASAKLGVDTIEGGKVGD